MNVSYWPLLSAHMRRIMIHDMIDIQLNNSPTCLISSPEAWKLEGRGLEALRWVDLTRGPNAARFNSHSVAEKDLRIGHVDAIRAMLCKILSELASSSPGHSSSYIAVAD